jgi:hypothetical protein
MSEMLVVIGGDVTAPGAVSSTAGPGSGLDR